LSSSIAIAVLGGIVIELFKFILVPDKIQCMPQLYEITKNYTIIIKNQEIDVATFKTGRIFANAVRKYIGSNYGDRRKKRKAEKGSQG